MTVLTDNIRALLRDQGWQRDERASYDSRTTYRKPDLVPIGGFGGLAYGTAYITFSSLEGLPVVTIGLWGPWNETYTARDIDVSASPWIEVLPAIMYALISAED